ncbi:MAG: hypothetical protein ACREDH_11025 [Methylocella sp.]
MGFKGGAHGEKLFGAAERNRWPPNGDGDLSVHEVLLAALAGILREANDVTGSIKDFGLLGILTTVPDRT